MDAANAHVSSAVNIYALHCTHHGVLHANTLTEGAEVEEAKKKLVSLRAAKKLKRPMRYLYRNA